ncbi:MAG: DUF309 domain-containing protein [Sulfolobales archaeon]|jgi:hypothetical protein|nr:DUF309 domain-containing protein [Sulfolobales archaeon]
MGYEWVPANERRIAVIPPKDPSEIKGSLPRERIIDVRTCLLTEVDGYVSLNGELALPGDLMSLLLTRRFWEAHEILEEVWRERKYELFRAMIMLLAAEIKLCKGDYSVYNKLVESAYSRALNYLPILLLFHSAIED